MGNYLGTAMGSDSAVTKCSPNQSITTIKSFTDSVALTSLQTLCGLDVGVKETAGSMQGPPAARLGWTLTSSSTWAMFSQLAAIVSQIQPLITSSDNEDLTLIAFRYFLCFTSDEDKDLRYKCLKLIFKNPALEDIYEKLMKNKLFINSANDRTATTSLESRFDNAENPPSINNLLQSLISTYSCYKYLQGQCLHIFVFNLKKIIIYGL